MFSSTHYQDLATQKQYTYWIRGEGERGEGEGERGGGRREKVIVINYTILSLHILCGS
jgi:hypothetical protein